MENTEQKKNNKTLEGIVVSISMDKTAVVKVDRFIKHPKYKKYFKKSKKYSVHDPENLAKVGDKVTIAQTKPISKTKTFEIINK